VCKWISSQPETFFIDGMKKWIERLKQMCSHKMATVLKISVQCVREINFVHSDIIVIILHCQKRISYNWRHYLSVTPRTLDGNRVAPCGRTDRYDKADSQFWQFCEQA